MTEPIRIKTFRSKSLQDAYARIRDEFGPAATILETNTKRRGLFRGQQIEVTASSSSRLSVDAIISGSQPDSEIATPNHDPSPTSSKSEIELNHDASANELESNRLPFNSSEAQGDEVCPRESTTSDVNQSLFGDFKDVRMQRICTQVYREFCDAGLDPRIVEQWLRAAQSSGNRSLFQNAWTLSAEIQSWIQGFVHVATPIGRTDVGQQVHILVGPSGVGKSTTVAKLAAHVSMHESLNVGVLQTDSRKLERDQWLEHYADLLGWEFEFAIESKFDAERFQECDLLFVDTQGCSPNDQEGIDQIESIILHAKERHKVCVHWVLSSTCNERTFLRCEESFAKLQPQSLILTKLDESGGLGPLFPCLQSCGTPVSYLTNGKHVPSHLVTATNARLARFILGTVDNV